MDELYNNKKLKPFLTKYNKKDWKDVILQLSLIGLNQVGNQKVYSIEALRKMNQEKEGVTSLNKNKGFQNSQANTKAVIQDNQKEKSSVKESKKEPLPKPIEISQDTENKPKEKDNTKKEEEKQKNPIVEALPKENSINKLPNENLPNKSDEIQQITTTNEMIKPKEEEKPQVKKHENINSIPSTYTYERRNPYQTNYSYCDTCYNRANENRSQFGNPLLLELNYDYTQPNIEDTIHSRYSSSITYTYQLNY